MFVLDPAGVGLLLKVPVGGDWLDVAWVCTTALFGICALAAGAQGWLLRRTGRLERSLLIVGGVLLMFMSTVTDLLGFACITVAAASQFLRRSLPGPAPGAGTA
jgi:TRAP-type uncharacterized transport system fused permease subunit